MVALEAAIETIRHRHPLALAPTTLLVLTLHNLSNHLSFRAFASYTVNFAIEIFTITIHRTNSLAIQIR